MQKHRAQGSELSAPAFATYFAIASSVKEVCGLQSRAQSTGFASHSPDLSGRRLGAERRAKSEERRIPA